MIAVVDTCYFLKHGFFDQNIKKIYLPSSVKKELLNDKSREHYNLYKYMIEIREPECCYLEKIKNLNNEMLYGLSQTDIEVVALTLELSDIFCTTWIDKSNILDLDNVVCLTMDNGVKQCLRKLNLEHDDKFVSKQFKMRCFACFTMYNEKIDFCRKCGMNTITRVSVIRNEDQSEKILLKKNYKFTPKKLVDNRGIELKSSGQREYQQYIRNRGYKSKSKILTNVLGDLDDV